MHRPAIGRRRRCISDQLAQTLIIVCAVIVTAFADERRAPPDDAIEHFRGSILPLLENHCFECHSHLRKSAEGGLVLDSRAGWENGGDSGPAIVPGHPNRSLLLKAVSYADADLQMPPAGRLTSAEVEAVRRWIRDGAFDDRATTDTNKDQDQTSRPLWSLQSVRPIQPPLSEKGELIQNAVDRFIQARLRREGITQNAPADRFTLLRRATFDLTGLPPSADQIKEFAFDSAAERWEELLDELLDSPHYGERWGRHWLDLARYGDSNGGDINYAHANAWKYRDYVIRSFNDDKPFNAFIREQLAGDLLAVTDPQHRRELITATGFLMLGPKMLAEVDTDKLQIDIVDEQLDVTGKTFLGMTFGCARCHDHKFDPITTKDYYALAGIFRSTKVIDVLRPKNGVSEWLEVDIRSQKQRSLADNLNGERKRLEAQLAKLGAGNRPADNSRREATQAVVVRDLPALNSTSWSAWVRIEVPQSLGAVISATYPSANQGHSLGFDNGATPRVVWNHGSGTHTIIAADQPVSFGEWHHLALTFDADSAHVQLFVDGKPAAQASNVQTTSFRTIAAGRREASHEFPLVGNVDEILVFDTALNDQQIHDLFERQSPSAEPLLAWNFEDYAGDRVLDSGRKQRNGQLVGLSSKEDSVVGVRGRAIRFGRSKSPNAANSRRIRELRNRINELTKANPVPDYVMSVAAADPVDLPIYIRGNHRVPSPMRIQRRSPAVFDSVLPGMTVAAQDNGRLDLANWIASPSNPLTARVMVNRIWQYHFGTGLVRTSSNFGHRGEAPSHPDLLDWLAREFIDHNWSVKHMHRLIMQSATYRIASGRSESIAEKDPQHRLLADFPVRRLEAEAVRDSLLAVSGELNFTIGGSLLQAENKKRITMMPVDSIYQSLRRSVYLPCIRVRGNEMFSVFDVSDTGQHTAVRPQTLVAQQALFLMNDSFVVERARNLAELLCRKEPTDAVNWLHLRLYGRQVTPKESETISRFYLSLSNSFSESDSEDPFDAALWQHIIHTMFCSNEFLHIR